jgi:hypothetical protein
MQDLIHHGLFSPAVMLSAWPLSQAMRPYVVLQVVQDASSDGPAENPLLEGGSTPEERQASFLELALCLAAGLPDAALDPLFVVSSTLRCCVWFVAWC